MAITNVSGGQSPRYTRYTLQKYEDASRKPSFLCLCNLDGMMGNESFLKVFHELIV